MKIYEYMNIFIYNEWNIWKIIWMIDEIYEKIIYMKKYMKYMKKSEVIKSL